MDEFDISILPNGDIHITRSPNRATNEAMLEILREVVDDPIWLEIFLKTGDQCEQLIGDETLCG
jgi:hypothetical protein